MNIGNAADASGVPPKTIRYYESIGLLPEARRAGNGYRDYGESDVGVLRFVQRARRHGFSIGDVAELLTLWRDKRRASADVKALALRHVAEMEKRIEELETLRRTLVHLAERCHGDERPDCPILDDLAGAGHGH